MEKELDGNSPKNYIFKTGTKLFSIHLGNRVTRCLCPACNGLGEIKLPSIDGSYDEFTCPKCYGTGYIEESLPEEWYLDPKYSREVTSINIWKEDGQDRITYYFGCNGSAADRVFRTKKEALEAIEKKNKELKENEKNK